MEQHNSLNPALINEILMAKVSETTGQLVEPIKRYRFTILICIIFFHMKYLLEIVLRSVPLPYPGWQNLQLALRSSSAVMEVL